MCFCIERERRERIEAQMTRRRLSSLPVSSRRPSTSCPPTVPEIRHLSSTNTAPTCSEESRAPKGRGGLIFVRPVNGVRA